MLKGFAMGMAEVVPGVSGGTIAFITGIYSDLLSSIRAFHPRLIRLWKDQGFGAVWEAINGPFLSALLTGMAIGIVIGVFGISWLIAHYPKGVWSFFFGLILASAWWVSRSGSRWNLVSWIGFAGATLIAYGITVASPATGNEAPWFILISGIIAISAMLLPGISGSFLLLLMGMYTLVIENVKGLLKTGSLDNVIVVGSFAIGCLIGLAGASRILQWIFRQYHNLAIAILTGFMLGSLNRLWPWKRVEAYRLDNHGKEIPFLEVSILPGDYPDDPQYLLVFVCTLAGFLLVWALGRISPPAETGPA